MKKRTRKSALPALLCLLLFAALLPMRALAAEAIDPDRDAALTIDYRYGGTALAGAQFDVYKVADVSPYTEFTLTPAFAGYPIRTDGLDADGWNALAVTLKGYVQADKPARSTGETDANGTLRFAVKPGLYLVIGKGIVQGKFSYTCAPFMVCVPDDAEMTAQNNIWNYDVTVFPKAVRDQAYDPVDPVTVTRKVLKVWEDHGYEIPKEVTVTLYRDGREYSTVTLNRENNWRHTWDDLERGHDWTLTEENVAGYTVKITQEGQTFVVTNTNEKPPVTPPPTSGGKLPQTGVLWWPVPVLLVAGSFFVVLGLYGRRRRNDA